MATMNTPISVIPAKAGIRLYLLPGAEGSWTPAFAGVTKEL
jgi:hypothetical protein